MKKKGDEQNESIRQLTLFDAIELELTGKFTFPETNKNIIHINNMIYDTSYGSYKTNHYSPSFSIYFSKVFLNSSSCLSNISPEDSYTFLPFIYRTVLGISSKPKYYLDLASFSQEITPETFII